MGIGALVVVPFFTFPVGGSVQSRETLRMCHFPGFKPRKEISFEQLSPHQHARPITKPFDGFDEAVRVAKAGTSPDYIVPRSTGDTDE